MLPNSVLVVYCQGLGEFIISNVCHIEEFFLLCKDIICRTFFYSIGCGHLRLPFEHRLQMGMWCLPSECIYMKLRLGLRVLISSGFLYDDRPTLLHCKILLLSQTLELVEQVIYLNSGFLYIYIDPSCSNWRVFLECLVTLAGRSAKEANLYTEISEGIFSYGITRHRHGK